MLIAGVSICRQPDEQSDTSPIALFESSTSVWQRSDGLSACGMVAVFVAFITTVKSFLPRAVPRTASVRRRRWRYQSYASDPMTLSPGLE